MRISLMVNMSRVVRYRKLRKRQKVEKPKLAEVDRVEEWEVEKILNKKKVRGVMKYLVQWKRFTVENNIWEKEEDLENAKEAVVKFKGRMNAEIRRQRKLNMAEESGFRQGKLPGKYTAKMLYRQDNGRFEKEYLRKLERN